MPSPHLEIRNRFLAKCNGSLCYGLGEWRRYEAGAWVAVPELRIKYEIQVIAAKSGNGGIALKFTVGDGSLNILPLKKE